MGGEKTKNFKKLFDTLRRGFKKKKMTGIEEVAALAPAVHLAKTLVSGRKRDSKKKKKFIEKCWHCYLRNGGEDEYSQKQEDSVVEYKDKSVKFNVLCCSSSTDARHVGVDLDMLARVDALAAQRPRSRFSLETSV